MFAPRCASRTSDAQSRNKEQPTVSSLFKLLIPLLLVAPKATMWLVFASQFFSLRGLASLQMALGT